MSTTDTIGATSGDTVCSPYQVGTDSNGENELWRDEVEAVGYVYCEPDAICGCQGTTFGIVYHSPKYLHELAARPSAVRVRLPIAALRELRHQLITGTNPLAHDLELVEQSYWNGDVVLRLADPSDGAGERILGAYNVPREDVGA